MHDAHSLQTLLGALSAYFEGEKIEALVFILPLGLLSLVFAGWLITDGQSGFSRGLAIPFLVMGLVMTTVGGVVGYRTPAQEQHLTAAIQADDRTPVQWIRHLRLQEARQHLESCGPEVSLLETAQRFGFKNTATFSRAFVAEHGLTPDVLARQSRHLLH
ncbi:MAG: AraC family transcriptional regulator [Gammaproteobacteria bacterium]|nr:AraC family transcriptional regulator [Gammaproteobacteria bacterium]